MSIPVSITKIKVGDETSFLVQIDEDNRKNKVNWVRTYKSSIKEIIQLKDQIDEIFEDLTLGEKLGISEKKGKEIENFHNTEALCSTCFLKESNDCIKCVFDLQSPLERKLFLELKKEYIRFDIQYGIDYYGKNIYVKDKSYDNPNNNFKGVLTIADFYLEKRGLKLCVYTDGHSYHERTESQASRDRKIDRKLQELDYKVLRFTGKDINENMDRVIKEIKKWIDNAKY